MTPPPPFNDPKKFAIPPECEPSKTWRFEPPIGDDDGLRKLVAGWSKKKEVTEFYLPCLNELGLRSSIVHVPDLLAVVDLVLGVERKTLKVGGKGFVCLSCFRQHPCNKCPWLEKLDAEGFEVRGTKGWIDGTNVALLSKSGPHVRDRYRPLADVYDRYENLKPSFSVGSDDRTTLEENTKLLSVRDVVDDGRVDDPGDTKGESAPGGDGCCEIRGVHAPHSTTRPPAMPIVGIVGGLLAVVAGSLTSTPEFFCTFGAVCFVVNLFFLFRLSK